MWRAADFSRLEGPSELPATASASLSKRETVEYIPFCAFIASNESNLAFSSLRCYLELPDQDSSPKGLPQCPSQYPLRREQGYNEDDGGFPLAENEIPDPPGGSHEDVAMPGWLWRRDVAVNCEPDAHNDRDETAHDDLVQGSVLLDIGAALRGGGGVDEVRDLE
ncbi:hypothetical protein FIBSPDRAFT_884458 [Athelia psychrophila]|uniref:Uncharacterized protein n=1 Tax=Athelia psychrophila TaxID=1759441 RepID=A0A166T546_9AGAM|nr:hypothetical protein FIBSPDRAFT_884458 [Fibularhizoctonia sp. CBS 109695]